MSCSLKKVWHIEAETKWPFCRSHFQMHFLEWLYFDWNVTEFVAKNPSSNVLALDEIMAGCQTSERPLSEPTVALYTEAYIDCLVQHCSNSSALSMQSLQVCTKPSICVIRSRRFRLIYSVDKWLHEHINPLLKNNTNIDCSPNIISKLW